MLNAKSDDIALNRNIRLYLIVPAVAGFSWWGLFVVLFNLFLLRLGYGPRFIGMLSALGPIVFILFSIPSGALSQRWGSRRLIIVGVSLYAINFTLLPWGEVFETPWREVWFVTNFLLVFLGGALFWPNSDIYLMQVTTEANRSRAFALRQALFPLAGFIGSLIAGQLPGLFARWLGSSIDQPTPYRYALMLCGLAHIISVIAMVSTDSERLPKQVQALKDNGQQSSVGLGFISIILPLVLVEMLWKAGNTGPSNFFNVFLDIDLHISPERIGFLLGLGQLVAAVFALATPWLARRIGYGRILFFSLLGMAIGLVTMAGSQNVIRAGGGYIILQALIAISTSAIAIYRMEKVDAIWWGWASGIAIAAQGMGESSILFAGGVIIEQWGFFAFFMTTAGVLVIGALFFFVYFRPFRDQALT
ncbi:MAG: MFS transporter [Chloroflexota bacterium]